MSDDFTKIADSSWGRNAEQMPRALLAAATSPDISDRASFAKESTVPESQSLDATTSLAPQPKPTASSSAPVRVIYVMGAGRSGSTALEAMLGDHEDAVAVGELANIFLYWNDLIHCSCGLRGPECGVWKDIERRFCELTGLSSFLEHNRLMQRFEGFDPRRGLGLPQWLRMSLAEKAPDRDAELWKQRNVAIYQAVADVTGKRVIIDSSKSPLRARALCLTSELDVRLVHLTRDVRGVAWSRLKAYRKAPKLGFGKDHPPTPVWRSVAYWGVMNMLGSMVRRSYPDCPSLLVRYEDYTTEPMREFGRISEVVGLDYTQIAERLIAGQPVRPQHTSAGNPVRMQGAIRLSPDYEWMEKLPESDRATCWRLASWMMRSYGYDKHPQVDAELFGRRAHSGWAEKVAQEAASEATGQQKAA